MQINPIVFPFEIQKLPLVQDFLIVALIKRLTIFLFLKTRW